MLKGLRKKMSLPGIFSMMNWPGLIALIGLESLSFMRK
jgi:hypothetical protein